MNDLGVDGRNILFVVGCPRSGTTWVQRILGAHPKIKTGQESDVFDLYVGPQLRNWRKELDVNESGRGGVGLACYFTESEFRMILKSYLRSLLDPMLSGLASDEIFLEKTPSHALFLPEIIDLLPRARILHVLREPRDVIASLLSASRTWGTRWAPRHVKQAANMWIEHVRAVRDASKSLNDEQFVEVRYEKLCEQPAATVRAILAFLKLEWDRESLAAAIESNAAHSAKAHKGTKIEVRGEFAEVSGGTVRDPEGFIRRASPGWWREDLSLWQRAQANWALRKFSDLTGI